MYRSKGTGRPNRGLSVETLEQRQLCVASLSVELAINGQATGTPPGATLEPGTAAELIYQVTNTGDQALSGVAVLDDNGTPGIPEDDFTPSPVLTTTIARGTLAKTFAGLNALKFLEHPTLPYVYATIQSTNSVAVINTETLTVEANVPLGANSGPHGMALTSDGTKLYVAMVQANKIAVIDTATHAELPSIAVGAPVGDIKVGADGRLFVLTLNSIRQIDPQTGASVGPNINHPLINGMFISQGVLGISADKNFLYYGDHGISPSSLYKINVTNPAAPTLVWESPHGPASNGRDLEFTRDGNYFSYVSVIGATNEYAIAKQRTSDMAILGKFVTGAYPEELVYSPNGAFAYTSIGVFPSPSTNKAVVWNASTFAQVGEITMPGVPHEMFIPSGGRYLFASVDSDTAVDSLYVYETGRVGNRNVGDLNENNFLDPGETWTFRREATVEAGEFMVGLSAIGIAGSQGIVAESTAYFKAVAPFAEVAAQAAENVMGLEITQLPHDPYVGPVTISDNRFLVSGRYLDLKPDQFLTVADDDGIVVDIRTAEATPRLLFRVTIDVVANERPWQRPSTPQDIDGNGHIVPQDALIIINHLHALIDAPSSELGARPSGTKLYLDVNGDGHLTAADALVIINWLHAHPVSFESEGEGEGESAAEFDNTSSSLLLLEPESPEIAITTPAEEDAQSLLTTQSATVASDWVFSLIETEQSTSRTRRTTAGVSSDTGAWWPDDEQDDRASIHLH